MPRKVTAYGCKFKCGHRITSKKVTIEMHERKCFGNPDSKSCKTCNHLVPNPHFFDEDYYREIDEQFIECKKKFFDKSKAGNPFGLRTGCEEWEAKPVKAITRFEILDVDPDKPVKSKGVKKAKRAWSKMHINLTRKDDQTLRDLSKIQNVSEEDLMLNALKMYKYIRRQGDFEHFNYFSKKDY